MAKVIVSLVNERQPASFQFATSLTRGPLVCDICIMDRATSGECWEVVTLPRAANRARWKSLYEERLRAAGLIVPDFMDPFTDFLPPDPRYLLARAASEDVDAAASIELQSLVYGVVPPGFVQHLPHEGNAPPLEPGGMYDLFLLGHDSGHLTFAGP